MSKKQAKYIVHGLVQGVGYRYFVFRQAASLNLTGYAKNLWDGTVEVVAEGDEKNLETLFEYLKTGPSRSVVSKVEKEYKEFSGKFDHFEIY